MVDRWTFSKCLSVVLRWFVGRCHLCAAEILLGYMAGQLQGAAQTKLYAYAVYRQEKGGSFSDPCRLPVYDALRACGAAVAEDPALMKSPEDRDVHDFAGPNRGTKIYKAVAADLKQRGAL